MPPARSVAASVVALGMAGTLAAANPTFATPGRPSPPTCDKPGRYAAQSGAELLRIDRLDLGTAARATKRKPADLRAGDPVPVSPTPGARALSGTDAVGGSGSASGRPRSAPSGSAHPTAAESGGASDAFPEAGSGVPPEIAPDALPEDASDPSPQAASDPSPEATSGGVASDSDDWPRPILERVSTRRDGPAAPVVSRVGLGEARSVLIADGPVNAAGAARLLDGKVAGSTERDELAFQKAPPVNPRANTRPTGSKKYGPVRAGDGSLSARAIWTPAMGCGNADGDTSTATAAISRLTVTGAGSASLVRVPERITSRSSTAMRRRGGEPQSVASATITAGRISLADNEVRIRVLRAPELHVSMTARGKSRVDYQPPVIEIAGKNGERTRLTTPGDYSEITLSDEPRWPETASAPLGPIGDMPLPKLTGLPRIADTEHTPRPADKPGPTLRIRLGDVRQATKANAVAARVTAIRVTLTRGADSFHDGPSGVVADFGLGVLDAAAVAPRSAVGSSGPYPRQGGHGQQGGTGRQGGSSGPQNGHGQQGGTAQQGASRGQHGGTVQQGSRGQRGRSVKQDSHARPGDLTQRNSRSPQDGRSQRGTSAGGTGLPVTGPGLVSLLIVGAVLIVGGAGAIILSTRRRRNQP